MATRLSALLSAVLVVFAGCGGKSPPEIEWSAFDGQRAYAHVQRLVSYGPRPAASPGLTRAATYITTQLQEFGLETDEQVFVAPTPRGSLQFRNIIGKTRSAGGREGGVIVVATHYDTKWMTNVTFVGADDGGSSVGAVLEMARVASTSPNLWFAFFDGEEAMVRYGEEDGLWGSKFFVEDLKGKDEVKRIKAMVLLDMMGNAKLNIGIPPDCTGWLVQQAFDAARAAGFRDSFTLRQSGMLDDHTPFLRVAIPAVDLIVVDPGTETGFPDYWHTDKDTLDKISPRGLAVAGQTALRLVTKLQNLPPGR